MWRADYMGKAILLYSKNRSFTKKLSYEELEENFYPAYDEYNNQIVFLGNNKIMRD
jgi:hypothetical protein